MKDMPQTDTRRAFLKQTGTIAAAAGAGAAAWAMPSLAAAQGANDRITLGIIGPGGQGTNLYRAFVTQKDVRIACVCDAVPAWIMDPISA